MKKIFSSPIVGEIPRLKTMLESAGIACVLRNEISSGLSPEIPVAESTPELWIQEDDRLTEALQIKADFQSSATAVGTAWQCQKCGEISEPQFSSCWNCGAARADHAPVIWLPAKPTMPSPDKNNIAGEPAIAKTELTEEVAGGVQCVACGKRIVAKTKYCPFCGWTQPREFYEPER